MKQAICQKCNTNMGRLVPDDAKEIICFSCAENPSKRSAKDRPSTMFAAHLCLGQTAVDRLNAGLCPICGADPQEFRDEKSLAEFRITGTCQNCQDRLFSNKEPY